MANKYYDSASAGATAPYESPETASTTLATALAAITVAGTEAIFINNTSTEVIGAATTFSSIQADANPQKLLSVSDFDASPGTLAAGAKLNWSVASGVMTFEGNWHIYGVEIKCTSGSTNQYPAFGTIAKHSNMYLESCIIGTLSTNATGFLAKFGGPSGNGCDPSIFKTKDCTLIAGHIGNKISLGQGYVELDNIILGGAVTPTTLFTSGAGTVSKVVIKNSDLSIKSWTNLIDVSLDAQIEVILENCKLPAGANLFTGASFSPYSSVTLINTSVGNIHYAYERHTAAGSITTNATIISDTNPIVDGAVSLSNKMATSANSGRGVPLERTYCIDITTLASITPYVEVLVEGDGAAALKNDELFITANYFSGADSPLGTSVTSCPNVLATPADIAAGTVTYTGDGYTTERTHRLTVPAFTPTQKGYVKIKVTLVKPSTTIYVGAVGVI